jgi:signal transduction histidine kinase
MSGNFFLDWALMSVSLFNTILQTWLGLTVLLNSDRRTWGIWLGGGGLLLGGAFFMSHSAVLGLGLAYLAQREGLWLFLGSIPAMLLPFAWYLVMLWYTGYWDDPKSLLHRRQRPFFLLTIVLLILGFMTLIVLADPIPQLTGLKWQLLIRWAVGFIPIPVLAYPFYVILCLSLSLDALMRPGPSGRVMGTVARQRARPWLVVTSVALLLVSLLIAGVIAWIVLATRQRLSYQVIFEQIGPRLAWVDLLVSTLIAAANLVLGQAVVSYEVFTGKTLPRRGLLRHWLRAVVLAAGYSFVVGESMTTGVRPVYSLLLATMLMTFFFALVSWRSYVEREYAIMQLRPFVTSEGLYERLLNNSGSTPPEVDVAIPFYALCRDVLDARLAYLVALGPLAPLVGPALAYPPGNQGQPGALAELVVGRFQSPQTMLVSLETGQYGGATWGVPLWSERGLIGVLLLGDKKDGSLYSQEEIEIARASGERLIDTQASAEMARRLMALQRQRLVESQVVDRQARRVLHDDVLPLLHAAMLELNKRDLTAESAEGAEKREEERFSLLYQQKKEQAAGAVALLTEAHHKISDLLRDMPATAATEVSRLGLLGALRRTVTNELSAAFDEVVWQIEPEAERQAAVMSPLVAEVAFYAAREAIRNAARYGRNGQAGRPLHLTVAVRSQNGLEVVIEDNGVGLPVNEPVNPNGGSGRGLALHSTMMAVVGGTLAVESLPETYTRVRLVLPLGTALG